MSRWALAIDTAGPVAGFALAREGQPTVAWQGPAERGSDSALAPRVAALLAEIANGAPGVVLVVNGPGTFTGLRVGVALGLGVAVARRCPVMTVGSLFARALGQTAPRVLALLDARKGRAYAQQYDASGALPVALTDAVDLHPSGLDLEPGFVAVGQGALAFADWVAQAGGSVAPRAEALAIERLAELALAGAFPASTAEAVGLAYLREPDITLPRPPTG